MLKKIGSIIFVFLCVLPVFAVNVHASNIYELSGISSIDHNAQILQKTNDLKKKYQISIDYPMYNYEGIQTAAIYLETLETLDAALSYVSPYVVQQVSLHYFNTVGKRLKISYRHSNLSSGGSFIDGFDNESYIEVAGFDPDNALIVLFIPEPGESSIMTGDAPLSIVHEFAHAVHMMIENKEGGSKIKEQWLKYNQNYSYNEENIAKNPNNIVFASGYAATSFYEDFAETFAYGFISNRSGLGLSTKMNYNGKRSAFGAKMDIVRNLLTKYFPDAKTMQQNFNKCYSAPTSLNYNGYLLSGIHLQYSGYNEARYFPPEILSDFPEYKLNNYKWVSTIGGWSNINKSGSKIIVFPDGTWGDFT